MTKATDTWDFRLVWYQAGELIPAGSRFTGETKQRRHDVLGTTDTYYLYEVPERPGGLNER